MLLRARIVLPISAPAIEDGAVLVAQDRVCAVGQWSDLSALGVGSVMDLGESILLPGLVNAHCHLDYTDMVGEPPPKQFPNWIKGLVARKASASYTDYAHAWLRGARMLVRTGTTTVADIEAVPELLPEVWSSTPLRVASFLEMTGVISRRDPLEIVQEASAKISSLPSGRSFGALSPHAIYSTTPALLKVVAETAARRRWRVTMHVAESIDEYDMCAHRRGALFDWLKPQRDMSDCGHGSLVQQIRRSGLLGENFLAVHANYLDPGDVAALAETGSSVAHCPRSHAYFRHQRFPYEALAAGGVNVCLGTDSLASMSSNRPLDLELNMFTEMQAFAAAHPTVAPGEILRMATVNGARALGLGGRVGEIAPESFADMIAIPYAGLLAQAEEAVVAQRENVLCAMIHGRMS